MSDRPSSGNFLDLRTLAAVGLTFLVWMAWQWHMQRKYPDQFSNPGKEPQAIDAQAPKESLPKGADLKSESQKNDRVSLGVGSAVTGGSERLVRVDFDQWSFNISSKGMGLKDITLRAYSGRDGGHVTIGMPVAGRLPGETAFLGADESIDFEIQEISSRQWLGRAEANGLKIAKRLEVNPDTFSFETDIEVEGASEKFLGLAQYLVDQFSVESSGGLFAPQLDRHEVYSVGSQGESRVYVGDESEISDSKGTSSVVVLGTPYFAQGFVNRSEILPELKILTQMKPGPESGPSKVALVGLHYVKLMKTDRFRVKFVSFFGPRSLNILERVDSELARSVDFGFFSSLGRPILRLLKWFYSIVGNWGVAIILLVLVVRFIVLPLHIMSYRSMKSMQVVQPMIKALQEKYKNDKERLNQEMVALFKSHKVNPLGGCLPMLLQIPVFLALYQVLGHSVELYQAPFFGWISDLSLKDPYFVLPTLMGATMFFQQKITPNTLDPAQAKIMLMMPIMFSFFMLTLPSGLTLYFLVSGVFGIVQQLYFTRNTLKPA